MRAYHGVHMYRGYKPWNLERHLKLENCHSMNWKDSRRMKKNRPFCGARCRDGHECKAKAVVNPRTDKPINGRCRIHGGLSSGAKSPEGKELCRKAAQKGMIEYWKRKKLVRTDGSAARI